MDLRWVVWENRPVKILKDFSETFFLKGHVLKLSEQKSPRLAYFGEAQKVRFWSIFLRLTNLNG